MGPFGSFMPALVVVVVVVLFDGGRGNGNRWGGREVGSEYLGVCSVCVVPAARAVRTELWQAKVSAGDSRAASNLIPNVLAHTYVHHTMLHAPAALNGLSHRHHCLVLSNNPPVQLISQVEQPASLTLNQLGQRDACGKRELWVCSGTADMWDDSTAIGASQQFN